VPPSKTGTIITVADAQLLGAPSMPEMRFSTSAKEAPQAAEFRLGIDRAGAVRYCFLERSSGDAALDEQARQHLLLCRFAAMQDPPPLLWTRATISWGNDIAAPLPPTGTPAP
jgi:hypothetical protein